MSGGVGYHTPDVLLLGGSVESRVITLPPDLWYLVGGALGELADAGNWEQFGSATPEQMAEFFINVLDNIYTL